MANYRNMDMREFMNITKALGDATRIRVLLALRQQELCACQITELFGLAQSTMSKHFYLLRQAGLVDSRKEGRWIYYALPGREASPAVREALEWVEQSLAEDPRITEDAKNLRKILKLDPVEICKRQCRS
jgi:DNA-binding transcriptional ArsR family regulator